MAAGVWHGCRAGPVAGWRVGWIGRQPGGNLIFSFRFKVCVPATKLAIQTPKRQPGAEGKAVMNKREM